jgi:hypothetical protein
MLVSSGLIGDGGRGGGGPCNLCPAATIVQSVDTSESDLEVLVTEARKVTYTVSYFREAVWQRHAISAPGLDISQAAGRVDEWGTLVEDVGSWAFGGTILRKENHELT